MSLLDSVGDKSVKDAIAGLGPMEQQLILALLTGETTMINAAVGSLQEMIRGEVDHFFAEFDQRFSLKIGR